MTIDEKLQAISDNNASLIYHLEIVLEGMKDLNKILEQDNINYEKLESEQ